MGAISPPAGLITASSKQPKVSYAEIARNLTTNKPKEETFRLHEAIRKCAGVKPLSSGTKAEQTHFISRIFVQGITRMPYKDLKQILFTMRFRLSKIFSLDYVGKKTLEFTVAADYAAAMIQKVRSYPFLFVLSKVDPTMPFDKNASEATKLAVKKAFTDRLQRAFAATNRPELASYFADLAAESGVILDSPQAVVEYAEESSSSDIQLDQVSSDDQSSQARFLFFHSLVLPGHLCTLNKDSKSPNPIPIDSANQRSENILANKNILPEISANENNFESNRTNQNSIDFERLTPANDSPQQIQTLTRKNFHFEKNEKNEKKFRSEKSIKRARFQ
ncbi:hypothetical protein BB561_005096 [Smittium simulii]|uniref:Uncharacterized protein n=1 Tax=Smittium simulii TaxID=133385 RepID=A0A2T9YCB2_9FUNG|nr:hypothetical protein BB561_005096 [Smittium simulii]